MTLMGMFQVRVTVGNPREPARSFTESFWVDTGATYSFIPRARLEGIGMAADGERDIVYANGARARCGIGDASFRIEGLPETRACTVVFAPADSLYLLGATALENFGLAADPDAKQLKPIAAIIGGFLASR